MRVVSYNILDGGEGRADPLAEVVLARRPDVVAVVEADNEDVLNRLAARFEMELVHATAGKSAAALFSRWPIVRSINHALLAPGKMEKSLLEVVVSEPLRSSQPSVGGAGAREWTFGVTHLHARAHEADERQREQEIEFVLGVFARHRNERSPHLLVGDFNSNAPGQRIDPSKCKPSTRDAWAANGGEVPRRVIQKVLDAGYMDTLSLRDPELAETEGSFTTQHPGQRVDYVFAHGFHPSQIVDAWIERDRLAKYASDHFPVGAEFVT